MRFGGLIACALLTAVVALPTAARAQYPRARRGQFEVSGLDFRPDGAWRKRAALVRQTRQALVGARQFSALNAAAPMMQNRLTGTYQVPVLPIAFKNVPPPFPSTDYQSVLFDPAPLMKPYSVKTFYEQLSNGAITIDGLVRPWIAADSNDTYYEDGCNGVGVLTPCQHPQRFGQLLLEALSKNDDGVFDWSQFDSDGDGYVDFVTFLQADIDGACPNSPHIWAHRYVISAWNGGSPYVTKTPWANHPGQFIKVQDYTIQSAQGGNNACTAGQIMPIGTVAHETGHAFGLPDLYDTVPTDIDNSEGIGEWGLMGSGNYARPYSPSRYESWSLSELGWVTVDTLAASGTVTLGPVQTSDTVLLVPIPNSREYYLLENRQSLESDTAQMNPTLGRPKSPGLLIWRIDTVQIDAHGFQFGDNKVNTGALHGVALMQADGLRQLDINPGGNRGDAGDSYPGSSNNHRFSYTTSPAAVDAFDARVGWIIDSIYPVTPGVPGPVRFRFVRRGATQFQAGSPGASILVNGASMGQWSDVLAPGTQVSLGVNTPQLAGGGRSRFTFTAWSNGGPPSQTYTAGATVDTITAGFTSEYRVLVAAVGGGTVVAGTPGDPAAGIYVAPNTQVTLTAATPSGFSFAGWTGDTTAGAASLVLPMGHGYNVTANFTSTITVALDDAVNQLLGLATPLDTTQVRYLDLVGNKNGTYDLGDFLAYLRLTGVMPSPALLQRVLAKQAVQPAASRGER